MLEKKKNLRRLGQNRGIGMKEQSLDVGKNLKFPEE